MFHLWHTPHFPFDFLALIALLNSPFVASPSYLDDCNAVIKKGIRCPPRAHCSTENHISCRNFVTSYSKPCRSQSQSQWPQFIRESSHTHQITLSWAPPPTCSVPQCPVSNRPSTPPAVALQLLPSPQKSTYSHINNAPLYGPQWRWRRTNTNNVC